MLDEQAMQTLKSILARVIHESPDPLYRVAAQIRDAKETVISQYSTMFTPSNLEKMTAEDFRGFLLFKNNRHWDSLHHQGGWMTENMPVLREAIKLLTNESVPLKTRLNRLRPNNGEPMVKGLGRAVITAILMVVYPNKYGVLNNTAENGMKQIGLWPNMPRAITFGERYEIVNHVLLETASKLDIDLWTLDMLWWRVSPHVPKGIDIQITEQAPSLSKTEDSISVLENGLENTFGLERSLQEFLVENWKRTTLGNEWVLFEEDGEVVGSYYNTGEVGEIDLLAKHHSAKLWLVIELKKDRSSDITVGQVLRYMGWVRKNLASEGENVKGLIISREIDRKLQYALDGQPNIKCMTYQVTFNLSDAPEL
jgi:hypothetical protein